MRIGELAQASAVSRDTLRFYEQRGLIVARRSANGYRDYSPDMLQLVLYINISRPHSAWASTLARSAIASPRCGTPPIRTVRSRSCYRTS